MSKWNSAHHAIDALQHIWDKGAIGLKGLQHLHSNDAVNKIGLALASPVAAVSDIAHGKGITKSLERVYGDLSSPNVSNIAGSAFTIGVGTSVAHGLTHDASGNPDIAGIPFI